MTDPAKDPEIPAELADLRRSIDNIDAAIIHMLAERFRCTQKVGVLKARTGLPPADPAREERQIARLRDLAHDAGLDPVFAEKFLAFVIAEVIHHHERIAAAEPSAAPPAEPSAAPPGASSAAPPADPASAEPTRP